MSSGSATWRCTSALPNSAPDERSYLRARVCVRVCVCARVVCVSCGRAYAVCVCVCTCVRAVCVCACRVGAVCHTTMWVRVRACMGERGTGGAGGEGIRCAFMLRVRRWSAVMHPHVRARTHANACAYPPPPEHTDTHTHTQPHTPDVAVVFDDKGQPVARRARRVVVPHRRRAGKRRLPPRLERGRDRRRVGADARLAGERRACAMEWGGVCVVSLPFVSLGARFESRC